MTYACLIVRFIYCLSLQIVIPSCNTADRL